MQKTKSDRPNNVAETPGQSGSSADLLAITPEERYRRIAEAAYLRAAARGFIGGDPVQDWLEAEIEVHAAAERKIKSER